MHTDKSALTASPEAKLGTLREVATPTKAPAPGCCVMRTVENWEDDAPWLLQGKQLGPPQSRPASLPLRTPSEQVTVLPGRYTHRWDAATNT